ncbi:14247_t:CDS:2 [Cetraspora pellucida]|uniref:14247_t:CDS:1 n=1 Tax=Cetraspora pellucida TaxID=1433469 RepID=A0A9N9ENX6_9GLOM|nr:14247_t:CDS:2 [Cetraspora pellucida]
MQKNVKNLPDKLSNKYVVSLISQRLSRNYTEDKFLKSTNNSNNIAKIDNINIKLEQIIISEKNKERETRNSYWYSKVELLALHIRNISKQLYISRLHISVDNMMIHFSGHSSYTF